MSFHVPNTILTLTVWHVPRFAFEMGTACARPPTMCIDIRDTHDKTGAGGRHRAWRSQIQFWGNTMQPDYKVTCTNFGARNSPEVVTVTWKSPRFT